MHEEVAEKNLFMMCAKLNESATSTLPSGFHVRNCKREELDIWKAMPFDDSVLAARYYNFMTKYYNDVYSVNEDLFFKKCLFVCNLDDMPVATCFAWKSYQKITTIHWFKVLKKYEGLGIGRALLSIVMQDLFPEDFPVFIHTHPSSNRAVKLYSDFGFCLLSDSKIGDRNNDLIKSLPILKKNMSRGCYKKLKITKAPAYFLEIVSSADKQEF